LFSLFNNLEVLVIYMKLKVFNIQKKLIKRRQIPLSPTFCLINYKKQGETYNNLIVDFSKPLDKNPLYTQHICYIILLTF
jgi:hypothetical protein